MLTEARQVYGFSLSTYLFDRTHFARVSGCLKICSVLQSSTSGTLDYLRIRHPIILHFPAMHLLNYR